jgi:integrase/recombinase XerD
MTTARLAGGWCGPLEPLRDGFRRGLLSEGYAPKPIELHLALFSHLSRWLGDRGLTPVDLTATTVEEFFAERRRRYSWFTTPRALAPLRRHLDSVGVVPNEPAAPARRSAVDELVEAYRGYLERDRGLAVGSIELYARQVRRFVSGWWPGGEVVLGQLDAVAIVGFVRRQSESLSTPSTKTMVCALRSFLRFLHATARTERPLADAVPSVADTRRASIPRYLPVEVVAQLLASCDTATATGRRDFAILRVLARLGLRAGEVAGLCLEDLDWRAGEVVITGKGRRVERMPLPPEVGEAVVAYLSDGRPPGGARAVFVGVDAPHRPLSRGGVRSVVYHACDRAGLERVGPHRLRHTVGTETLRAGASMAEVSQLLRHRRVETTAVYAKVDRTALETLARPWPAVPS